MCAGPRRSVTTRPLGSPPYNRNVPSNQAPRPNRFLPYAAALLLSAALTSCAAAPAPPPPPAAAAGAALQDAGNSYRSDFRAVVAEGAANYGGMPCGKKCWDLTHLQRDDTGVISGAYKRAKAAYAGTVEGAPAEIAQWASVMEEVKTDIIAWGGRSGANASSIVAKTFTDLDRADALVDAFAPASVRAEYVPPKN